jgi:hypothetical protein
MNDPRRLIPRTGEFAEAEPRHIIPQTTGEWAERLFYPEAVMPDGRIDANGGHWEEHGRIYVDKDGFRSYTGF